MKFTLNDLIGMANLDIRTVLDKLGLEAGDRVAITFPDWDDRMTTMHFDVVSDSYFDTLYDPIFCTPDGNHTFRIVDLIDDEVSFEKVIYDYAEDEEKNEEFNPCQLQDISTEDLLNELLRREQFFKSNSDEKR